MIAEALREGGVVGHQALAVKREEEEGDFTLRVVATAAVVVVEVDGEVDAIMKGGVSQADLLIAEEVEDSKDLETPTRVPVNGFLAVNAPILMILIVFLILTASEEMDRHCHD